MLQELDSKRPLNLAFIFGNARSGKSFMLNALTGVQSLFKVVNSAQPCTKGYAGEVGKGDVGEGRPRG